MDENKNDTSVSSSKNCDFIMRQYSNCMLCFQNYLNSFIKDLNGISNQHIPSWLPDNIKKVKDPVQIKLLCGADLLESFAKPGLWADEDVSSFENI